MFTTHGRDPFRNEFKETDEDDPTNGDYPTRPPSSSIVKLESPHAISQLLTNTFPDRISRFMFGLVVLLLLIAFALWLSWIITNKWVQQQHHPTVIVTLESLPNIPPLNAVGFLFPNTFWDMASLNATYRGLPQPPDDAPSSTIGHFVIQDLANSAGPVPMGSSSLYCDNIQPRNKSFMCQPTKNGQKLFGNDPTDTQYPDLSDPNVWDYQLRKVSDQLCFTIWSFLDTSQVLDFYNYTQFPYRVPSLQSYLSGPETILQLNAWLSNPNHQQADLGPIIDGLPGVFTYQYNKIHTTSSTISKFVPLSGTPRLTYTIANRDELDLTDEQVMGSMPLFYQYFPWMQEEISAWLAASPLHKPFFIQYCLRVSDMNALVSTEVNQYGPLPFFSDLGGFLSMLMLVITILFPIAAKVTEVRRFLPFILLNKYTHHDAKTPSAANSNHSNVTKTAELTIVNNPAVAAPPADSTSIPMTEPIRTDAINLQSDSSQL